MRQLSNAVLATLEIPPQSSGAGTVNGAGVDMQGWDGVMFVVNIGAITGAATLDAYVNRDDNSGFNSPTNINGAALTQVPAASNTKVAILEVARPSERYVRCTIITATNTVAFGVTALRYRRGGVLPPTQAALERVTVQEN